MESNPSRSHLVPFVLTKNTRTYQPEGPNICMKSTELGPEIGHKTNQPPYG